jgi:hypothetical protein
MGTDEGGDASASDDDETTNNEIRSSVRSYRGR